nr:immunoglobulin light chain junction region [Macaca mulatta]MOW43094.1 immunoglobulin light chain junction region [Macaca mulatta]
CQQSHGTPFTF